MLVLRQATRDDLGYLTETFISTMREAITVARGKWNEPRERAQFEQQLELEHTSIIEHEGTPLGFLMAVPRNTDLLLHTLCIAPSHQSRAFGAKVTALVVQSAQSRGLGVVLSVLKANPRARAFYERLGFAFVGESEHHNHFRLFGPLHVQPSVA